MGHVGDPQTPLSQYVGSLGGNEKFYIQSGMIGGIPRVCRSRDLQLLETSHRDAKASYTGDALCPRA